MDDSNRTTTARIKEVFVENLDLALDAGQLVDDMSLYSPVIQMDSMALLQLLVALEKEFEIEIDDEDVMNTDLTTVGSLVEMVHGIIHRSHGGGHGRPAPRLNTGEG
jgi:acyl carrier protein